MPAAAQEIVGALDDGWHFSERVACYEVPLLRETFWPSLSFPARAEVLLDEYSADIKDGFYSKALSS